MFYSIISFSERNISYVLAKQETELVGGGVEGGGELGQHSFSHNHINFEEK